MVSYKDLGLVNTREMFAKAIKGGYAVPAFNFNNMEQLKEWFADAVSVAGKKYVFEWNGQEQCATVIGRRDGLSIRFMWDDETSRAYFEMSISVNEMTDDTTLIVTDYAEPDELDDSKELWETQVDTLRRAIGC